jgi:ATP-binding cassette, subfamily D (ALD), peroxisomal long-chain fatty acid import protein
MYAYKDLLELAGLTTRLYTLLSTLHALKPLPTAASSSSLSSTTSDQREDKVELSHVDVSVPQSASTTNVPLVLVRDLSLSLRPGEHLMITGSNGVGKTSVARVIAGLWAARAHLESRTSQSIPTATTATTGEGKGTGGGVSRPRGKQGVFVVPQRSYMVTGSLLDQVVYPDSYAEFVESGRGTGELRAILEAVSLGYLPEREGGWFTRKEWRDVLSGGEKQRVSLTFFF